MRWWNSLGLWGSRPTTTGRDTQSPTRATSSNPVMSGGCPFTVTSPSKIIHPALGGSPCASATRGSGWTLDCTTMNVRANAAVARTDHWINPVRPAAILAVAFITRRNIFGIVARVNELGAHWPRTVCGASQSVSGVGCCYELPCSAAEASAFRVLRCLAGPLESIFLGLTHARVTCQQLCRL